MARLAPEPPALSFEAVGQGWKGEPAGVGGSRRWLTRHPDVGMAD